MAGLLCAARRRHVCSLGREGTGHEAGRLDAYMAIELLLRCNVGTAVSAGLDSAERVGSPEYVERGKILGSPKHVQTERTTRLSERLPPVC